MLKEGQKVRLKDPDQFYAEIRRKAGSGRVGVVVGFTSPTPHPIVVFPAIGRKRFFRMGMVRECFLEAVEESETVTEAPAAAPAWTPEELTEFDRLAEKVSSRDQVTRINGRFAMKAFVEKHGKEKCDAMFLHLTGGKPE